MSELATAHAGEVRLGLDYAATTLFEIELAKIGARVPEPLVPVEVRPGVGLVSLTVITVAEGGVHGAHGPLPAYGEAVFCVHVEPDLAEAVPDMSILVLSFAATHERALAANADHHDLDIWPTPIRVAIEGEAHRMHVSDADGPIATITCAHPSPRYRERPASLQVYTAREGLGSVRRYDERFELRSFRHQRRAPAAEFHEHPMFRGVPVAGLRRPYLQWLCEPGQPIVQIATVPTRAIGARP